MKEKIIILVLLASCGILEAREITNFKHDPAKNKNNTTRRLLAMSLGCEPASQSADLDINNVRTKILNGGDMWWDLDNPKYEIPKIIDANATRKHSLFAGALWIGGLEKGSDNLKLAAMTYRQRGSDFWPGPLDVNTANTEASRCQTYDKVWKVTREEIEEAEESDWKEISSNILEWPGGSNRGLSGIGNANETNRLAPFRDLDGDNIYEPFDKEYPVLFTDKPENAPSDQPDMMLWYVYNDNGNIHSETGGIPIGLELQMQAFAYNTNDEVNNMTFYRSTIINRGQTPLQQTYMGQWVDPDLGNPSDDKVGCDISRSLGICYNGDDNDEGTLGYGLNPPTVGIDYFEGPIDDNGAELGLSHFVAYNNTQDPISGNPDVAIHYYNYLRGRWKNGQPITDANGNPTPIMFPLEKPEDCQNSHVPEDKRFVQSTGPFSLNPGDVNHITVGVVWARGTSGGACGSLELLKKASDKAQKLFNNKFELIDGPEAPDLAVQELENEVVLSLLNTDNKKVEGFVDTLLNENNDKLIYEFQGYRVFQLKDPTAGVSDIGNIDKVREVFQCDKKDAYDQIINLVYDPVVAADIPVEQVNGLNEGITNSISINEDLFSTASNKQLINFKTYYYLVLSYAVVTNDPSKSDPLQYLAGRNNIKIYKAIPHKNEPEKTGVKLQSEFGSGPKIKTIAGKGNGGNILELSEETLENILLNNSVENPIYIGGNGPLNIKIVDPLKVPLADFRLEIIDTSGLINATSTDSMRGYASHWKLTNLNTDEIIYSDRYLDEKYESVQGKKERDSKVIAEPSLHDWGMSITVNQVKMPGNNPEDLTNNLLSWDVVWEDEGRQWLSSRADVDGNLQTNWIRAGKTHTVASTTNPWSSFSNDPYVDDYYFNYDTDSAFDQFGSYEKIWGGRIAPYILATRIGFDATTGRNTFGVAHPSPLMNSASAGRLARKSMNSLASVDLVFTKDKSKWTQCVVVETGDNENAAQHIGKAEKFDLRASPSKDKNGKIISGEQGRSWFPGYAINVETGKRLNIIFGEDSYLPGANGTDMLWNPTSDYYTASSPYPVWGGKHYIYIMGDQDMDIGKGVAYDGGKTYLNEFNAPNSTFASRKVMNTAMWVVPAIMAPGFKMNTDGTPPSDVKIKLRVAKPYATREDQKMPIYEFNTSDLVVEQGSQITENALDLINVVPNPYYAYSEYESSPIDGRIKITNLPPKCTINIFSTQGLLVKTINKESEATFVDWNLKNNSNVQISGGMYIIHIKVPDKGERTIKWFGVMRSLDLDSY